MRIKEFSLRHYGPLEDSGRLQLQSFNLFWGENENGKTLTQEALIRLLLGKARKIFPDIDRIAEEPDGYIILENAAGETFKVPEMGQVTDLLGLSPEECRNLLVIRNSDLTIARENEFYGTISERLAGLRTSQIRALKKKLRPFGYFTEGLDTINNKDSHYLKRRLENARTLLKECESLARLAVEEGYHSLEQNFVNLQEKARKIDLQLSSLEKARRREKYERGRTHLALLEENIRKLEALKHINEEELNRWQQSITVIQEKQIEKEQVLQEYQLRKSELEAEEKHLKDLKNLRPGTQKRKDEIDELLKPLISGYGYFNEKYARTRASRRFFGALLFCFAGLTLLIMAGNFYRPDPDLVVNAIFTGIVSVILTVFYYFRVIQPRGKQAYLHQQIISQAGELGIEGEKISHIQEQIQRFEDNIERQQQRIGDTQGRVAFLKNLCKSLQGERLRNIDKRLKEAEEVIQSVQLTHHVETLDTYRLKYQERHRHEQAIKESLLILRNLFGSKGKDISENLQHWQIAVDEMKLYQDSAKKIEFDEKALERSGAEQKEVQQAIKELQRQLREIREKLQDIQRRANETILAGEEPLQCENLSDLPLIARALKGFLSRVTEQQQTVKTALDILEEIEKEENRKVNLLFGEDSTVSHFYREITEGLYPAVYCESAEAGIQVMRRDGKILQPNWLSGGAFDQLYFAIRLSLGEKLLRNEKGFLILDDPFLKSDGERLKRQLQMLLDITRKGWQIIYFSAKEEVKFALDRHIANNQVVFQPLPGVSFKNDRS